VMHTNAYTHITNTGAVTVLPPRPQWATKKQADAMTGKLKGTLVRRQCCSGCCSKLHMARATQPRHPNFPSKMCHVECRMSHTHNSNPVRVSA
jgi:hypothetical protein